MELAAWAVFGSSQEFGVLLPNEPNVYCAFSFIDAKLFHDFFFRLSDNLHLSLSVKE
jgi:hypothetical protein